MKPLFNLLFLFIVVSMSHIYTPVLYGAPMDTVAYKAAVFTDPGRAEKVRATAAVVESIFREHAENHHLPGFVFGIVLDGNLIYSGGFGYANLEQEIKANTKSLFRIASMSKSFTALAILQLRDAGKLNLDDPISKYLEEAKNLKNLTEDAPEITIRHLLTHGAGFPEDNPWGDRQLADTDEALRQFIDKGVSFSNVPGVKYEYSNLGFALLGQIIQEVSGMGIQQYTRENIFKPLGMNATVWEYENAPEENLALGYNWIDESYVNIPLEHHGSFGAMGGLITSIEDFARYASLHLSAWPPRNDVETGPLKRSSLREMHHPWRFYELDTAFVYPDGRNCPCVKAYGYGLGWMQDCDGRVYIGHSGGLPGFGSNWRMIPDYGLAVLSFDNRTYGSTSDINIVVLDTIVTLAGLQPRTLPVSNILEIRKNAFVKILPDWKNAGESGLFAENFFIDNRLKDMVKRSRELYQEAGEISRIGSMKPENQLRGTFIMEGEKKNIEVFFTLTPEKEPLIQEVKMNIVEKSGK